MLDAADVVAFLDGGRIVATGTHAELLGTSAGYRRVVTRETELGGRELVSTERR